MFTTSEYGKSSRKQPVIRRQEVDLRIVPLGFLVLITSGAAMLVLPWAHRAGQSIGALDAFLLSVSATFSPAWLPM